MDKLEELKRAIVEKLNDMIKDSSMSYANASKRYYDASPFNEKAELESLSMTRKELDDLVHTSSKIRKVLEGFK